MLIIILLGNAVVLTSILRTLRASVISICSEVAMNRSVPSFSLTPRVPKLSGENEKLANWSKTTNMIRGQRLRRYDRSSAEAGIT